MMTEQHEARLAELINLSETMLSDEDMNRFHVHWKVFLESLPTDQDRENAVAAFMDNLVSGLRRFTQAIQNATPEQWDKIAPGLDKLVALGEEVAVKRVAAA